MRLLHSHTCTRSAHVPGSCSFLTLLPFAPFCARAQHVNVVRVYGAEQERDQVTTTHFLALEPCVETSAADGVVTSRTLSSLVRSGAASSRGAQLSLLRQTARGLQYLHGNRDLADHGLTHRDLKPDNVLVKRLRNGEDVAKLAGKCARAHS